MFKNSFSFDGRIRRTEYGISLIIFYISLQIISFLIAETKKLEILELLFIPLIWFIAAQGSKRCHDKGKAGWYQIIPFYVFALIFTDGDNRENKYGLNSKNKNNIDINIDQRLS